MAQRRLFPLTLLASGLLVSVLTITLLATAPWVQALPPGGTEVFQVSAEVSAASRLGQETISFTGTATIDRTDPHMEDGVEVVDTEIVALNLTGESLTGTVSVTQYAAFLSLGEIRSLQPPPDQFPASSFFDVFLEATIPASGSRTPARLHNEVALHLVPTSDEGEVPLEAWPPLGVKWGAQPEAPVGSYCDPTRPTNPGPGGLPLVGPPPGLSPLPAEVCLLSVSLTLSEPATPTATITPCPPELCTPTLTSTAPSATATRTPRPTSTPRPTGSPTPAAPENPTFSVAPGGPSGLHPADLLALPGATAPIDVSGNDNFADAWEIAELPFAGRQSTSGFSTEAGEPLNPNNCVNVLPNEKGATAWYRFAAPTSGQVTADTVGSDYDTVLAAYTGSSLNALTSVACNDDAPGLSLRSRITFSATAGTVYRLQAGGFGGDAGEIAVNVTIAGGGGAGTVPLARVGCGALGLTADGCDTGADGDQDDIDALSFGTDFDLGAQPIAFSVAPGSSGAASSAVALQAACSPPQPQADEFSSDGTGANTLVFDGDGLGGGCLTAASLGLTELPTSDDLDALNNQPPSFVDTDGDGDLDEAVYFSLAPSSPSLTPQSRSPADVLFSVGGAAPGVYASASSLGLQTGDDIDGLCLADRGDQAARYEPALDTIHFSLATGSPSLAALGASAADVLGPGPEVLVSAADLGLASGDDLDAMKCFTETGATPTATPAVTATPTRVKPCGDVNDDGRVNSIDASLILQLEARLLGSLRNEASGDVNRDGRLNSIDASIILQREARLITTLRC